MEKFSTVLLASFLYSFFHFFRYPVEAHNFIIFPYTSLYSICKSFRPFFCIYSNFDNRVVSGAVK